MSTIRPGRTYGPTCSHLRPLLSSKLRWYVEYSRVSVSVPSSPTTGSDVTVRTCSSSAYRSKTETVAGWARSRHPASPATIRSSTSHGRSGGSGKTSWSSSTVTTANPSSRYSAATTGVEQATTALSGVSSTRPAVATSTAVRVTWANRGVGRASTTGTTRDGTSSSSENRSMAASRRA